MLKASSVYTALNWVLILITAFVVVETWVEEPTIQRLSPDQEQNLVLAYNVRHHGVFSVDEDRTPDALRPSRYREPLPVLALAGYLFVADPLLGDLPINDLTEVENLKILKYSNIPWSALMLVAMLLTARRLQLPIWATALAVLLTFFCLDEWHSRLYTEVPAAALIALASYLAFVAIQERRLFHFFAAGLSFGLLVLTKTSFFYVAIVLLLIYIGYALLQAKGRAQRRFVFSSAVLMGIGTILVVGPWMLRNQIQFSSPNLSDRGGIVLLERAVKNGMTQEEYAGTFYSYAPWYFRKPIGALTGHKPEDLLSGGKLERLDRYVNQDADRQARAEGRFNDIVSYHHRVVAIYGSKLAAMNAAGHPDPRGAADAELKREAIAMIKAHPLDHIAMTLPFLWRGAPYMAPFLIGVLIYAWRRRDAPLAAYLLPTLGIFAFYAAFSHFIPRYADPNVPVAAICFALFLHRLVLLTKSIRLPSLKTAQ